MESKNILSFSGVILLAYFQEVAFYLSLCNLTRQNKVELHENIQDCESIALPELFFKERSHCISFRTTVSLL